MKYIMRYYFTHIWMTIMTKKSISKNVEKLGGLPGGPGVKTLPLMLGVQA